MSTTVTLPPGLRNRIAGCGARQTRLSLRPTDLNGCVLEAMALLERALGQRI